MNEVNGKFNFSGSVRPIFQNIAHSIRQSTGHRPRPTCKYSGPLVQMVRVCACVKLSSLAVYFNYFYRFQISCASLQGGLLDRSTPLIAQMTKRFSIYDLRTRRTYPRLQIDIDHFCHLYERPVGRHIRYPIIRHVSNCYPIIRLSVSVRVQDYFTRHPFIQTHASQQAAYYLRLTCASRVSLYFVA